MKTSGLVMFACAGLLLSGGAILGSSVIWNMLRMSYYFWTSDLGVELSSSVLLASGALLCLPTAWLCTLLPYHNKSLPLNAAMMALVSLAMVLLSLGLSSMADLYRVLREPSTLNSSMLRAVTMEPFDPAVRSSFAAMQLELRCCGVQSHTDWYQHRRALPPACCGRMWNGKRPDASCEHPVYSVGCLRPALAELRYFCNSTTTLASSVVIVLSVALFTAAYILVTSILERNEFRVYKPQQPMRISCITHPPPPLVTVTSPALVPAAPF